MPLEQVIAAHLDGALPGHGDARALPVPRHARRRLRARRRRRRATCSRRSSRSCASAARSDDRVRLEVDAAMSRRVLDLLSASSSSPTSDVYRVDGPLDLSGLWSLDALDRPELKDEPWTPSRRRPARFDRATRQRSTSSRVLRDGDVLVHHPYDSFATSVEAFVEQAAPRPDCARDQADALPHRGRREPDRGRAHPRRRTGQAGRRARRAEGALRRAGEHRAGRSGSRRRACTSSTASSA